MALAPLLLGATPSASLEIDITGLRSARGMVQLCLTQEPRYFPDCAKAGKVRRLTLPAAQARVAHFVDLPAGDYAVAVIHDENGNGRLDKMMGIPREGVGFSRNPRLRMGPPSFADASFRLSAGPETEVVRLKYFL